MPQYNQSIDMKPNNHIVSGLIVDILQDSIFAGEIEIIDGIIATITPKKCVPQQYIIPGFIDAHVHIESSLLAPQEFARIATTHGVIAALADPHEIANILGIRGIEYMIKSGKHAPIHFFWGAPASVPATAHETTGARLSSSQTCQLLQQPDIYFLAEVMNYQAVLNKDSDIEQKISCAQQYGKPVDGHCPGLRGKALQQYIQAGISTDHESISYAEAREKIEQGLMIHIRSGSAADNLTALAPLMQQFPDQCMLCSDDITASDLLHGSINRLVEQATDLGCSLLSVLKAAHLNTKKHYKLPVGTVQIADPADFIIIDSLTHFTVLQTFVSGQLVAQHGKSTITHKKASLINNFKAQSISPKSLQVQPTTKNLVQTIGVIDQQIITKKLQLPVKKYFSAHNQYHTLAKIVVYNRYKQTSQPAVGFIQHTGLQYGAIASSVAHDAHNIVAIGASDIALTQAITLLVEHKGGLCVIDREQTYILKLPIAGLMSNQPAHIVAYQYQQLEQAAHNLGISLHAPFMTLSFMTLLVIPTLKISDRGLFDVHEQKFVNLFTEQ